MTSPVLRIPVFDYKRQLAPLRDEVLRAAARVLDSGSLILGEEVKRFETAFAATLGLAEAVGVDNGTDALAVAMWALGIRPGDEVLTVPNTAVPTVSAIRMVGATPVFCDVDPRTALMDLDAVQRRIGVRTKAVVPVHLYGNAVDVARLRDLLDGTGIAVIEDCAQAHGARSFDKPVGTLGHAAAFSFYPTKNLGAFGDGGLVTSPDARLVAEMRKVRLYGFEHSYYAEREGINTRLDELHAALLSVKLPHLPRWVERRRAIAARYERQLRPRIRRIAVAEGSTHSYHLYVVRLADRDKVRAALAERGIGTGIHYPHPIPTMRGYAFLGHKAGEFPHAEALAKEVLSLPMFPELLDAEVDEVAAALNALAG